MEKNELLENVYQLFISKGFNGVLTDENTYVITDEISSTILILKQKNNSIEVYINSEKWVTITPTKQGTKKIDFIVE